MKTKTDTSLRCEYFIRMTAECVSERQEDKTKPNHDKRLKEKDKNKKVGGMK